MSSMYDAVLRKQTEASVLRQSGFELSELGKLAEAIEAHTKARAINEDLGDIGAAAGDVTNTAIVYEQLSDWNKAEEFHLEAAHMDEQIGYKQGLRIDYNNLARFYATQGNFDKALEWQMKLIEVNLALGDVLGSAVNYRDRARILTHLGRIEEAIQVHQQASKLNQMANNVAGEAGDISYQAILYEKIRNRTKSIELHLQAVALNQKIDNYVGLRTDYEHLARLYAEQGDLNEARNYQDKLALIILRSVNFPQFKMFLMDASGIKGSISILKRQADTYEIGYNTPSPIRTQNRSYSVIINDTRLDNINQRIRSITDHTNKAKQLRGDLSTDGQVATLNGIEMQIFNELRSLGKALYAVTLPPQVKKVYKQLQGIEAIELGISEHLVSYPWELMHDETDFMCLSSNLGRYVIVDDDLELPSIRRVAKDRLRILVIGDPCNDDGTYQPPFNHLKSLPGARKEAQLLTTALSQIAGIDVQLFVGEQINTVRLISELSSDYDFVHFTGHAVFAAADPMESGLVIHDGIVRAYEILQCVNSQQPPVLVFINACESSREIEWGREIRYENQVFGLASAFLRAGINYIGALWPLHDDPAIGIAVDFYHSVFNGSTFGEALKTARQRSYQKYGQKEIAWASYILYGDPTSIVRTTQQNTPLVNDYARRLMSQNLFGLER